MIGFEILAAGGGFVPNAAATGEVTARALGEGLVLLSCDNNCNVIRILVPLTVPDAIIEEGLDKLALALPC